MSLEWKMTSLSCGLRCKTLLCKSHECWWNSANIMQIQIQTIILRQWPGLVLYLLGITMLAFSLTWADGCNPDVARNDEQMTSQDRKKEKVTVVNLLIIRPHWMIFISVCLWLPGFSSDDQKNIRDRWYKQTWEDLRSKKGPFSHSGTLSCIPSLTFHPHPSRSRPQIGWDYWWKNNVRPEIWRAGSTTFDTISHNNSEPSDLSLFPVCRSCRNINTREWKNKRWTVLSTLTNTVFH